MEERERERERGGGDLHSLTDVIVSGCRGGHCDNAVATGVGRCLWNCRKRVRRRLNVEWGALHLERYVVAVPVSTCNCFVCTLLQTAFRRCNSSSALTLGSYSKSRKCYTGKIRAVPGIRSLRSSGTSAVGHFDSIFPGPSCPRTEVLENRSVPIIDNRSDRMKKCKGSKRQYRTDGC